MGYYPYTPLEQSIAQLYDALEISQPCQLDLEAIAGKLGIWIHYAPYASQAFERGELRTIVLDSRLAPQEQWQDFGHELCHVLHHAGQQLAMGESFIRFQETKANNFAYQFCVPSFMLLRCELPERESAAASAIAAQFRVTPEFARERLKRHQRQLTSNRIAEKLTAYFHAEEMFKRAEGVDSITQTKGAKMLFSRKRGVVGYWREYDGAE